MLRADPQDVRVAFFRTVKHEAVIQVDQTTAESEFLGQEFNRDKSVVLIQAFAVKHLVKGLHLHREHEEFTGISCE